MNLIFYSVPPGQLFMKLPCSAKQMLSIFSYSAVSLTHDVDQYRRCAGIHCQ